MRWERAVALVAVLVALFAAWPSGAQAPKAPYRCAAFRKTGPVVYVDEKTGATPVLDLPSGWEPVGGGPDGEAWTVIACREAVTAP